MSNRERDSWKLAIAKGSACRATESARNIYRRNGTPDEEHGLVPEPCQYTDPVWRALWEMGYQNGASMGTLGVCAKALIDAVSDELRGACDD